MIGIVSGLVGLATISAVLRIVARVKRHADIGIDDYLCIAAVILMFGMLAELVLCKARNLPILENELSQTNMSKKTQGVLLAETAITSMSSRLGQWKYFKKYDLQEISCIITPLVTTPSC